MITKEKAAEKYFSDVKPKHLKVFDVETPEKNKIKGFICKKPNKFLGSMLITEITHGDITFETEQFVQAMPKIEYFDYHRQMYQEEEIIYHAYEKLDGSCLILYGIYDENNKLIEIVPKTRGIPVADKHVVDMYNELDHSNIKTFFNQLGLNHPTLLFELYGTLNQHSIYYPKTRINIKLIGGTYLINEYTSDFLIPMELKTLSHQYDFKMPDVFFKILFHKNIWKIIVSKGIPYYYLFKGMTDEEIQETLSMEYPTQQDSIYAMRDMLTTINKNYKEVNGHVLTEGVVLNGFDFSGNNLRYIKIKPKDIEEKCKTENGVPRKFILKEVHKYFDEYGSKAKEIYLKDETHYYNYVVNNLLEEFDVVAVEMKRTKSRIKNIFLDMLEAKEPPKGLQEICNNLKEEYPDEDISGLMRLFAQKYPEKKRQASSAYNIFEKII